MYQVVISKTLAPKELVKVYESNDRVVLPLWDPMVRYRINLLRRPSPITCRVRSPDVLPPRLMDLAMVMRLFFSPIAQISVLNLENPDLNLRDLC